MVEYFSNGTLKNFSGLPAAIETIHKIYLNNIVSGTKYILHEKRPMQCYQETLYKAKLDFIT